MFLIYTSMKIIAVILLIISVSKILSSLALNSSKIDSNISFDILELKEFKGMFDPSHLIKFGKFMIAGDGLIGLLCALFILFG